MEIFDSHTHLNDASFRGKEDIYLERAKELGVVKSAVAGQDPGRRDDGGHLCGFLFGVLYVHDVAAAAL